MSFGNSSKVALAVSLALGTTLAAGPRAASAEQVQASAGGIEEVVVTARKREETLRDVSAAINVVGGDALRASVINDVRDLQQLVPELTVGETVGEMKLTMRGLGNSSNTRGEDSQVAFHVDGAVVARTESQAMALFDLDRIEVLRGPQGTLYGRNATAGAINLVTAKPTAETRGYVNVTAGNYDLMKVDAAVGGSLSDRVEGRIAIQSINRGGYGTNITTGNQIDDQKRWAARGQLLFNLRDDLHLLLSAEYATEKDATGLFTYLTPLYVVNTTQFPPPASQAPKGVGGFSDPATRDGAGNIDPSMQRKTRALTATLTWNVNDALTLKDILSYRDLDFYLAQDLDLSSVVPQPVLGSAATVSIPLFDRQMTNELQATYTTSKLTVIGGIYWFTEGLHGTTYVGETPALNTWFYRGGRSTADSYAGFFNVNYKFNDMITGRIGGRYNDDKRKIDSNQWVLGVLGVPFGSPTNPGNSNRTDNKYTGEYGLDVHLTDRAMIYYTFAQGYEQGAGIIMQTNNPIPNPTTVKSNELGFKFETADRRFGVDIALYDEKIVDLQRTEAVPLANGTFATIVNNINGLDSRGVELNAQWIPVRQLKLAGGVTYTDAKFRDFISDDPLQFGTLLVQLAGNRPNLTPKWKGNLAAEYAIPMAGDREFAIGVNGSYTGAQFFDEFNRAPFLTGGYTLFDTNLTYRPTSVKWSVGLWGKNLGDLTRLVDASFSANGRVTSKKLNDPRTYGLSINVKL